MCIKALIWLIGMSCIHKENSRLLWERIDEATQKRLLRTEKEANKIV
jgi:hypothetical protein